MDPATDRRWLNVVSSANVVLFERGIPIAAGEWRAAGPNGIWIEHIEVRVDLRGMGIGKELLNAVVNNARLKVRDLKYVFGEIVTREAVIVRKKVFHNTVFTIFGVPVSPQDAAREVSIHNRVLAVSFV